MIVSVLMKLISDIIYNRQSANGISLARKLIENVIQ